MNDYSTEPMECRVLLARPVEFGFDDLSTGGKREIKSTVSGVTTTITRLGGGFVYVNSDFENPDDFEINSSPNSGSVTNKPLVADFSVPVTAASIEMSGFALNRGILKAYSGSNGTGRLLATRDIPISSGGFLGTSETLRVAAAGIRSITFIGGLDGASGPLSNLASYDNLQVTPVPIGELRAVSLSFDKTNGGADISYSVSGNVGGGLVEVYWSSTPSFAGRIKRVISKPAATTPGTHSLNITARQLDVPPDRAKYLILVLDSGQKIIESNESNNTASVENDLAGLAWFTANQSTLPYSVRVRDLSSAHNFRQNMENFVAALRAAGVTVTFDTTFRSEERHYVMKWAWQIGELNFNPARVPAYVKPTFTQYRPPGTAEPLDKIKIRWNYGDLELSRKAAKELITAFKIVYAPAEKNSNHSVGLAVDMKFRWDRAIKLKSPEGVLSREIPPGSSQYSQTLWNIAETFFGIKKHRTDRPHWSYNGT